ncbi:MAG: MFS transporter [Clostridiaceae bacterium]|jgi:MFS family permease|nr:MFS transporter [Clostridiaceae bacterium]
MNEKLWTKKFCLISLSNFFVYIIFYSIIVVLTLYSIKNLNSSPAEAGLAAGIFLLSALVARILAGHKIEYFGKRKMMLTGLIFYFVTTILYFFVNNVFALIIVRVLHGFAFGASAIGFIFLAKTNSPLIMFIAAILTGFGFGTFAAMGQVVAIQKVKKERIGIALSTLLAISELGTGVGPFVIGSLLSFISFQLLYLIMSIIVFISAIAYFVCKI